MDFSLKVVIRTPLHQLWTDSGFVDAERGRQLTVNDIKSILPEILFVVADVGLPLNWIGRHRTFEFWKNEVREHILDGEFKISLDEAPGGYVYLATEWIEKDGKSVVLLEKHH